MILMMAGRFLRVYAARGAAGSGLVLDPEQARADLKPWAQTAGGLVKDVLEEIHTEAGAQSAAQVKVRCQKCRTLNEEDAKFCKNCASAL